MSAYGSATGPEYLDEETDVIADLYDVDWEADERYREELDRAVDAEIDRRRTQA